MVHPLVVHQTRLGAVEVVDGQSHCERHRRCSNLGRRLLHDRYCLHSSKVDMVPWWCCWRVDRLILVAPMVLKRSVCDDRVHFRHYF